MTLEGHLGVNESPSSAGSRVAKSLEGARILGTNRVLQGAAKKRMFSRRRWDDAALNAKRRDRECGDEGWGLHRFLTPWPSNAFRETVVYRHWV